MIVIELVPLSDAGGFLLRGVAAYVAVRVIVHHDPLSADSALPATVVEVPIMQTFPDYFRKPHGFTLCKLAMHGSIVAEKEPDDADPHPHDELHKKLMFTPLAEVPFPLC